VEMEMGNAPQREYIVKNLQIDPEDVREERNFKDIIEISKNVIENQDQRIENIRRQIASDNLSKEVKIPYRG